MIPLMLLNTNLTAVLELPLNHIITEVSEKLFVGNEKREFHEYLFSKVKLVLFSGIGRNNTSVCHVVKPLAVP